MTRCDVAVDLYGDTLFSELRDLGINIARAHGIDTRDVKSPTSDAAGKTFYLGSRKSTVFARIYEKGKKDGKAYRDWPQEVLDPWVRIELEVKPQKDMKAKAASIQPHDFWGVSAWTKQLAEEALSMSPEPIPFHPRRTATDQQAYTTLVAQYRNLAQRRLQHTFNGDREAFLRALGNDWFGFEEDQSAA